MTAELEQLKAKAEQVQESIRSASATVRSPDGAVAVTVGPGGALQDLKFDSRAYRRPPEALSALVIQLIAVAQKRVSAQVATAFGELVDGNSQAMRLFEEFAPQDDDDEGEPQPPPHPAPPPPPPAPRPPAPPPPAPRPPAPRPPAQQRPLQPPPSSPRRRPAAAEDDDDDFQDPW